MERQVAPPDPALTFGPLPTPPVGHSRLREAGPERSASVVVTPLSTGVLDEGLWPAPVPTFTYLAGAAGSGKTFMTRTLADADLGVTLCATTGIAAINLGGETINSVLGYFDTTALQHLHTSGRLAVKLGRLWSCGVTRLVIDEVSMLGGDQLGFLVEALTDLHNGRVLTDPKTLVNAAGEAPRLGLMLVGDFCQLPPVKAPFAFESPAWAEFAPHVRTLTTIHRQADRDFIEVLRAARRGDGGLVAQYFGDHHLIEHESDDHYAGSTIVATNAEVDRYNAKRLEQLPTTETVTFLAARWGQQRSEWGNPDKPPSTWGIPPSLTLKVGALVMILANRRMRADPTDLEDSRPLIYVNGDLGILEGAGEEVVYHKPGGVEVRQYAAYVRLQRTGTIELVFPVERTVRMPCDAKRREQLRALGLEERIDDDWETVGTITYMPLRVAYATTVHKSQGLSLDAVQVNVRDEFFARSGMLYVALSRARTAPGLRLVGSPKVLRARCTTDPKVRAWL